MDSWNRMETASFVHLGSRGITNLKDVGEFMERKCRSATRRPLKELEDRLTLLGNTTQAYDLNGKRWDRTAANSLIQRLVGGDEVKNFLSMMAFTEDDKRLLAERGYTVAVTSAQPTFSIPATAGGFGMHGISTSLSQVEGSITATSRSNPLRRTASEHDESGEVGPQQSKRRVVLPRASGGEERQLPPRTPRRQVLAPRPDVGEQSGPYQAEASLSASLGTAAGDDRIAQKWSKGEDMNDASWERWALTLGKLPEYQWAWAERAKINDEIHANERSEHKVWNYLEDQEVACWATQGLGWSQADSTFEYHLEQAPRHRWQRYLSRLQKYQWAVRLREAEMASQEQKKKHEKEQRENYHKELQRHEKEQTGQSKGKKKEQREQREQREHEEELERRRNPWRPYDPRNPTG